MTDTHHELLRRALLGFGEMFHALAGARPHQNQHVRTPDMVGAHWTGEDHDPFFDAVVVPLGATPPLDARAHHVWTAGDEVPGRMSDERERIPTMGVWLDDLPLEHADWVSCPISVLAQVNERAYGVEGFEPMLEGLDDPRVRSYGLEVDGAIVCVAMGVEVGEDLGVHYVATESEYRRRGLATRLVGAMMHDARARGLTSSTLQASVEGLSVWRGLGFETLAMLHPWVTPMND